MARFFFFWRCQTWRLNCGLPSNKPTYYLVDYGDDSYLGIEITQSQQDFSFKISDNIFKTLLRLFMHVAFS